jgi:hypothetical protein
MKKLLLALAIAIGLPSSAFSQCNGVFQPGFVCGNPTGSPALPKQATASAFTATPAGSPGQIQYNNSGVFGAFTASGDATINTATGVVSIPRLYYPLSTLGGGP